MTRPKAPRNAISIGLPEAAKRLSVSETTLGRMARTGEIPAYRIGSRWKFSPQELQEWAREQSESQARQLRQVAHNAIRHPFPIGFEPPGTSPGD